MGNNLDSLLPWEALLKKVLWTQIGQLSDQRILDFGSGIGVTANHYAANNAVVAVEPSEESVQQRWDDHPYRQIIGGTDALWQMPDESFDVIFCHNVLEYAPDREEILREFYGLGGAAQELPTEEEDQRPAREGKILDLADFM